MAKVSENRIGFYVSRDDSPRYMREDGTWHYFMCGSGGTYFDAREKAEAALARAMGEVKLEVGKTYELNNGEIHKCTRMRGDDPLFVDDYGYGPFVVDGMLYHRDGRFADGAVPELDVKRCVYDVVAPKLWRDMTQEEKGALLLAHHEGKVIEWTRHPGDTEFRQNSATCGRPVWDDKHAYRVQTKPKRETVTMFTGEPASEWGWTADNCSEERTHRITFDLIDCKPDCASIRMEEV